MTPDTPNLSAIPFLSSRPYTHTFHPVQPMDNIHKLHVGRCHMMEVNWCDLNVS